MLAEAQPRQMLPAAGAKLLPPYRGVDLREPDLEGLRAGSGITVGVLGTFIGVRRSLELSSLMVVAVAIVLFARNARDESRHAAATRG